MRKKDIKEIAIEAGLDPDLWGYERAFEQFVELLELEFKKEHAGICKDIAAAEAKRTNLSDSHYTRTVSRARQESLKWASISIEKKPPC
mgnify:CR=1 FL=1|tara:strand:- start:99 stop:365 length:267 start_codon:yes stop_codon:yes gene_type:complete